MPNVITLVSAWVCNLKEFEKPRWSSPSFSSPHLTAFLIFSPCHLSGSSVIGTLTTCSGPAGFLSCKEKKKRSFAVCATAKVCSHLPGYFPFTTLQLNLSLPRLFFPLISKSLRTFLKTQPLGVAVDLSATFGLWLVYQFQLICFSFFFQLKL